jgi:hypothetical protein
LRAVVAANCRCGTVTATAAEVDDVTAEQEKRVRVKSVDNNRSVRRNARACFAHPPEAARTQQTNTDTNTDTNSKLLVGGLFTQQCFALM